MTIYHLVKNILLEYYYSLVIQFFFSILLFVIYEKAYIGPTIRNEKDLSLTVSKTCAADNLMDYWKICQ
jgi:hypothetical protein